jgi:hypothetical protein
MRGDRKAREEAELTDWEEFNLRSRIFGRFDMVSSSSVGPGSTVE